MNESKKHTTKQRLTRLENVCTQLYVQAQAMKVEIGKLQKTLAGYDIVADEEE